ncbi:MAG: hypothetical protein R3277_11215 [Brumimicrobium sp.]|nr:hypothetical protein [Brumimicrobium sp.]
MTEQDKPMNNEKKSRSGVWILLTIVALLGAGVLGWMYSEESAAYENCQVTVQQMEKEMEEMNSALSGYIDNTTNDLRKDFQNMLDTYDQLIKKDASKADSLRVQKERINELLEELNTTKRRSFSQISKLKKENEQLRSIMKNYLYTIDSLNTLNVNLTSELDKTSSQLSETKTERDNLKTQAEKSAELLAKGAKLNAFNFNTKALRYRMNGNTHEVNRAGRVDVIQTTFTIGENTIAKTGEKMVYMQVIDPNGQVIYSKPDNVVNVSGQQIIYTDKREIDYQGQNVDMTIVHNLKGDEIPSGNYTVKIFADGALIGKDSFTLK